MNASQPFVTDEFRVSLAETITWCLAKPKPWNPQTTFRSLELAYHDLWAHTRREMIRTVVDRRSELIAHPTSPDRPKPATSLNDGRLLAYYPDVNMFDGLSASECENFVNVCCVAAWDTWVDFFEAPPDKKGESMLVSWVPAEFHKMLDSAVEVDCVESIRWVDTLDHDLARELRNVGLDYPSA